MWIVRVALQRPYTFIVLALLLLILGPLTILRTPTDIFPEIGIPVVGVIWQYNGLPAEDMARLDELSADRVQYPYWMISRNNATRIPTGEPVKLGAIPKN